MAMPLLFFDPSGAGNALSKKNLTVSISCIENSTVDKEQSNFASSHGTIDLLHNNFSSRNAKILREARKDDEGVYGEYTPRRTDEAAAKIFALQ